MAATAVKATLDGFFKTVYGNKLQDLIPTWGIFQKDIKFSAGDPIGKDWRIPVVIEAEQGVSYLGKANSTTQLSASVTGATQELTVESYQHVLRSQLDYKSAFSAAKSEQAFKRTTSHIVESMWMTHRKRVEVDMLYGQVPLGVVSSTSSSTVTFTLGSWAPGIWAGMKGAGIYICDAAATTARAAVSISGVTLTQTSTTEGGAITVNDVTGIAATDLVYLRGSYTTAAVNCMMGIDAILTHSGTTSSTGLFGTTNYQRELLTGVQISAGSTDLSFGTIQSALEAVSSRGADSDYTLYISPKTWANLMNDQASLRRYDASYKESKMTLGAKSIEFYGPGCTVTIKAHPMVKWGEAFGLPNGDAWKRLGTTDITFNRPDMDGKANGNSFFLELQDYAIFELRSYDDQQIFTYCPAKSFKITSIVNTI